MRALVWMGKKHVEVQRVPGPRILNPRDCIVRITSTAICGSDIHLFNGYVPTLEKADRACPMFVEKRNNCIKVVLDPAA